MQQRFKQPVTEEACAASNKDACAAQLFKRGACERQYGVEIFRGQGPGGHRLKYVRLTKYAQADLVLLRRCDRRERLKQ